MIRVLIVTCAAAVILARCDCGDEEAAPTEPTTVITPNDTSNTAIDSSLFGMWNRYDAGGTLIQRDFAWITDDSIVVTGQPTLRGIVDSNPDFSRALVAQDGQVYYDPRCESCPNEYFYDYTLLSGALYLLVENTSDYSTPSQSTPLVIILRRGIDTLTDVSIITDSLIGIWDEYDSTWSNRTEQQYLVITADSIVYRPTVSPVPIVRTGIVGGDLGRTLIARNGQIWYDYHLSEQPDMYWYDYAMIDNGGSMYFADETTPAFNNPGPGANLVIHYLRKR